NVDFFAGISPGLKALSVLKIFAHYMQLWIFPWPLFPFYDWTLLPPATSFGDTLAWLGAAEFIGLVALAIALRRRAPLATLGISTALIALVPVIHLVPLPVGAAERFLYLPSIGACLASAIAALALLRRRQSLVSFALVATIVALGSWTMLRNTHWRSDLRLQEQVVADYPGAFSGHYNLGKLHLEAGRPAKAAAAFARAETCLPGLLTTATWLAAAHLAAGSPQAALKVIAQAEAHYGAQPSLGTLRQKATGALGQN
ncbi:MAG: hypothetical protein JRH20_14505, partial [Deltaproteobacteria bacterium]|nr:hypothetical protein [Deltaproteobacteria bacterium]